MTSQKNLQGLHACAGRAAKEDWATWIQCVTILDRRAIAVKTISPADVLEFLYEETPIRRVVITQSSQVAFKRIGCMSRVRQIDELMFGGHVTPGFWISDDTDVVLVPLSRGVGIRTTSTRKTYEWAVRKGLPYIYMHDNDHAWFSHFPPRIQRKLFLRFLSLSLFRISPQEWRISRAHWCIIREGLFAHGWTMNRQLCSCHNGIFDFVLWGGVPRVQLTINKAAQPLSQVRRGLRVRVDHHGLVTVKNVGRACPLGDDYGTVSQVPD